MFFHSGYAGYTEDHGDGAQGSAGPVGADSGAPFQGWPSSDGGALPFCFSDPYQEQEATRSAAFHFDDGGLLTSTSGQVFPLADLLPAFGGSFGDGKLFGCEKYVEQPQEVAIDCTGDFNFDIEDDAPPPPFPGLPGSPPGAAVRAAAHAAPAVFAAGARPPRLSSVPFNALAPNAVEVQGASPAELGMAIQACMLECFDARPSQVNAVECSLQVKVSHGCVSCTAKFLIYEVAPERYLVETTRQSGDAVLFVAVFRRWKEYLQVNSFDATAATTL